MGGQLDGIFLAGSLPHEFIILIVTLFIYLWLINFSLSLSISLAKKVRASPVGSGRAHVVEFSYIRIVLFGIEGGIWDVPRSFPVGSPTLVDSAAGRLEANVRDHASACDDVPAPLCSLELSVDIIHHTCVRVSPAWRFIRQPPVVLYIFPRSTYRITPASFRSSDVRTRATRLLPHVLSASHCSSTRSA